MTDAKLVKRTEKGQIYFCSGCNVFHMEFGNISLRFDIKGLIAFKKAVASINEQYWEEANKNTFYRRKIHMETQIRPVSFIFNSREVSELKNLLNIDLDRFFRLLYTKRKIIFN